MPTNTPTDTRPPLSEQMEAWLKKSQWTKTDFSGYVIELARRVEALEARPAHVVTAGPALVSPKSMTPAQTLELDQEMSRLRAEIEALRKDRDEAQNDLKQINATLDHYGAEDTAPPNEDGDELPLDTESRVLSLALERDSLRSQLATARQEGAFGKAIDRDVNGILDHGGVPRVQPRDGYNPTLERVRWACDKIAELEKGIATARAEGAEAERNRIAEYCEECVGNWQERKKEGDTPVGFTASIYMACWRAIVQHLRNDKGGDK